MIESKLLTAVHDYAIRLDKARYRQHRRRDFLEVDGSAFPEWKALAQTIGPDPTPRAAVEFYASVIIPRVRPSVKDNRVRNLLFRFCESLGSATELSAITQVHVSNFRSELIAREFANSSINRYMDDVYAFLRCCRDNGLLKFKYRRLRPFPTERRLIYLSPSELHRLLEASPVHLRQCDQTKRVEELAIARGGKHPSTTAAV